MFYVYILYSQSADRFYVGQSEDPHRRLTEHNSTEQKTYTSKYRPWELAALFQCGMSRSEAMKIERFIKKQKSRTFIQNLVTGINPVGELAQLVRVQHMRD
jgi:putative endonuclease